MLSGLSHSLEFKNSSTPIRHLHAQGRVVKELVHETAKRSRERRSIVKASEKVIEGRIPRHSRPRDGRRFGPGGGRPAQFSARPLSLIGPALVLVLCFAPALVLAAPPTNDNCPGALVIPDGPYPVKSAITKNVGQATSGDPQGTTGSCAAVTGIDHGVVFIDRESLQRVPRERNVRGQEGFAVGRKNIGQRRDRHGYVPT